MQLHCVYYTVDSLNTVNKQILILKLRCRIKASNSYKKLKILHVGLDIHVHGFDLRL